MPNFGLEFHLGRLVGIFWREGDIDLKEPAFVGCIVGAFDVPLPVPQVSLEERDFDCRFFGLRYRNAYSFGELIELLPNPQLIFLH